MKNFMKGLSALVVLLVAIVGLAAPAMAWGTIPAVDSIDVNGIDVDLTSATTTIDVERGEELDIEILFDPTEDITDLEVTAKLVYDEETVTDSTGLFDLVDGKRKSESLTLTIPEDISLGDARVFIVLQDKDNHDGEEYTFDLYVTGSKHDLVLDRVLMSPKNVVKAGSYITVQAKVLNLGVRSEDDILVSAEIEGLEGTYDSELLIEDDEELKSDESETSEELYLGVPLCAEAGEYRVKVSVLYNNDKEEVVEYFPITVVESASSICKIQELAAQKVTVPEASQTVKAGESLVVPVTITNTGKEAKNYVVDATVGNWGYLRFAPANVATVEAGATKTLYVYVDTTSSANGAKVLGLTVKADGEVVRDLTLTANVEGKESFDLNTVGLRKVLEIGLVVLIVLIVLVGLIIGFNKLRDDDDFDDEDDKTYY